MDILLECVLYCEVILEFYHVSWCYVTELIAGDPIQSWRGVINYFDLTLFIVGAG